jgi:tetratricopeptide (TPR) repeat protein
VFEEWRLAAARGDIRRVRVLADSLLRYGDDQARRSGGYVASMGLALMDGRLRDFDRLFHDLLVDRGSALPTDGVDQLMLRAIVAGPASGDPARLDSAIARIPFRDLSMIDRPYLRAAASLARIGSAEKARAMLARYRAEMTDTSIVREQSPHVHSVLAEIALAEGKPRVAIEEFRRGDVGYDGLPVDECGACVWYDLARAYDAAGQVDSATVMFERYLSTPFFAKPELGLDPVRVPAIHERLGQLYESMGKTDRAAEQYRAFIDLWKNADPNLQPRVTDAKRRLARLTSAEKPR